MTTERAYFGYENRLVERLRGCKMSTVPFGMALEAADEIERLRSENERLKEWCRKLIEGGTFPGEADNLRLLNAELVAALERARTVLANNLRSDVRHLLPVIDNALAKVKEVKPMTNLEWEIANNCCLVGEPAAAAVTNNPGVIYHNADAADEIGRLRSLNAELVAALEAAGTLINFMDLSDKQEVNRLRNDVLNKVRAALAKVKKGR